MHDYPEFQCLQRIKIAKQHHFSFHRNSMTPKNYAFSTLLVYDLLSIASIHHVVYALDSKLLRLSMNAGSIMVTCGYGISVYTEFTCIVETCFIMLY